MSMMTRPAALRGGVGRRDRPGPYRPLRDFAVEPVKKLPRISPDRWPHVRAWLSNLELPVEVTSAAADVDRVMEEAYVPPDQLVALGVPSLLREGREVWEQDHQATRVPQALSHLAHALRDVADALHDQCRAGVESALAHRDEAQLGTWLKAAISVRRYLPTTLVGVGRGVRREPLAPGAPEWKLTRPDLWHETGRPALTAATLADHRDTWGAGLFGPSAVHDHLLQLGHRCRCCEQ